MTDTTGGEGVKTDAEWPNNALSQTIYDHFTNFEGLNPDEAGDSAGALLYALKMAGITYPLAAQPSAGAQGEGWASLVRVVDAKGFTTLHAPDEDGKAGDLVASIWNEDYLPVAWGCATCNSPRSVDPCPKCGTALTKPADGWEWPGLPDIYRIRELAREVGYGVGVHGSQERDFDLIAAPWVDEAVSPLELSRHIAAGLGGTVVDYVNQGKPHARWSCNIHTPDWTKLIDLSVMPPATPAQPDTGDVAALREALEAVVSDCELAASACDSEGPRKGFLHIRDDALAALSKPNAPGAASFQARVLPWLIECFGADIASNIEERCDRFIEEALEQVQSLHWPRERALALVDYVYGRPIGEPHQEAGGVMVTFAALCQAAGLDMQRAGDDELARIMRPEIVQKIRAKQAAKPTGSALPIAPEDGGA